MGEAIITGLIAAGVIALVWHSPLLKPWFGFRKPKGHPGRWFQ